MQTVKQHLQRSVLYHVVAFRPFTGSDEPIRISELVRWTRTRREVNKKDFTKLLREHGRSELGLKSRVVMSR